MLHLRQEATGVLESQYISTDPTYILLAAVVGAEESTRVKEALAAAGLAETE